MDPSEPLRVEDVDGVRLPAATVQPMPRTDRPSRLMNAPLSRVSESLVDREALETWLPPDGMTGRFERSTRDRVARTALS